LIFGGLHVTSIQPAIQPIGLVVITFKNDH
jgi:hypothetical protein